MTDLNDSLKKHINAYSGTEVSSPGYFPIDRSDIEHIEKNGSWERKKDAEEDNGNERKSTAEAIVDLALSNIKLLFRNQYEEACAQVEINGHIETLKLKDSIFKDYLVKLFYERYGIPTYSEAVSNAISVLRAKARFEGQKYELNPRVVLYNQDKNDSDLTPDDSTGDGIMGMGENVVSNAVKENGENRAQNQPPNAINAINGIFGHFTKDSALFYDLTRDDWIYVKVTSKGWSIEKNTPIPMFVRHHASPQVLPSRSYNPNILDRLLDLTNIKDEDDRLLVKGYIISLFFPDIPKPVLMLNGGQGAAKSTCMEFIKMLVDPSIVKTMSMPTNLNELIQQLDHNYLAYYDNISYISDGVSDELCRAVTGSGSSKREIYTVDDDKVYSYKRCLGINGINLAAKKSDLLERGIIVKVESIPDESREYITLIWKRFEKLRPQILGYIFDVLVKVLKFIESGQQIHLTKKPRMADFCLIGEIASRIMGEREGRFVEVYFRNRNMQTEEVVEATPIAQAIMHFVNKCNEQKNSEQHEQEEVIWKGTASILLSELDFVAEELQIHTKEREWPKNGASLSRKINEIKVNLRQLGIIIEPTRDPKTNHRLQVIKKILLKAESLDNTFNAVCSSVNRQEMPLMPLVPLESKIHAQNHGNLPNGIANGILGSNENVVSKYDENHAQNSVSNGINAINGISRDFSEDVNTFASPQQLAAREPLANRSTKDSQK